jgi:CBS domain-containing protein
MQLSTIIAAKGANVITVPPDANVADLVALLAENRIGALVVSEDGHAITGIVSERDVVQAIARGAAALSESVASIMTTTVFCAPPEAHIEDLMALMTEKRVRHIPITDGEGLMVGIVSIGDIVKMRLGELEGERQAMLEYITKG